MRARLFSYILLLFAGASLLSAQTYSLPGQFAPQFFDNNGLPLGGGLLYSCGSGSSCPGTPATTYQDSSGFSVNTNPIVLDSSGRPSNGSAIVSIFLNTALSYKFVLKTSAGVTISTTDNVTAGGAGGGSSTNYWTLSGSTISNNNGSGAGNVNVGADLRVAGNLPLFGSLKLRDGSTHYAILRANSVMTADVTWRWPATDALGVLTSDGMGNLTWGPGGSGSGGTPAGSNTQVQFNNTNVFGASPNFIWGNATQLLTVTAIDSSHAGVVVANGFIQADAGFYATVGTATTYNAINAPGGGMAALSFTATKYVNTGNSNGTPTATSGDSFNAGAIYCDTGSSPCVEKLYNGSAWVTLATGGATSPGGANTNVQFNSAGSFGGSANLTYATQLLTSVAASSSVAGMVVVNGYMQADAGFLATASTATTYNAINAPGGGMFGLSFTATKYVQTGNNASGPPSPTSGDAFHYGAQYYDIALGAQRLCTLATCTSSTGWVSLGTGGSGGAPGGPNTSVQYNATGVLAGDAAMEWNTSTHLLTITTIGSVPGLAIVNGYGQADQGFLATGSTATTYNAIQAPGGGLSAKSLTALNYVQTGNSSGIPAATSGDAFHYGAMYFDTGLLVERLCTLTTCSGSGWVSLATGGIPSLNGLTGALSITGTANEIIVTPAGSNITLTTPQAIGTASSVLFGTITSGGFIASAATGASLAFQAGGGTFQVLGSGAISGTGVISANGSSGAVTVPTNTQFNAINTVGGVNACSAGTCQSGTAIAINGNLFADASRNVTAGTGTFSSAITANGGIATGSATNSTLYIGTGGNFYTRPVAAASTAVSCAAVADGWLAVTSDFYVVVCSGGARFRSALSAF